MEDQFTTWHLYKGTGPSPDREVASLPDPPPWRRFSESRPKHLGSTFKPSPAVVRAVNAALYLRRPLLVTGKPGSGKSSLAESIAWDLSLGEVLRWPINSRSTVAEGVYRYDAIARLHATQLSKDPDKVPEMSKFLSLGPLGTALSETTCPRVLLVDEIDKSDIDFPNDLLNVLEDGEFEIPELARLDETSVTVRAWKGKNMVTLERGMVKASHFPVVVFTSNGEREFPPAFLRRCLRLDLDAPSREDLLEIVKNHLGPSVLNHAEPIVDRFLEIRATGDMPNDHLLNAVYLVTRVVSPDPNTWKELEKQVVLRPVTGAGA